MTCAWTCAAFIEKEQRKKIKIQDANMATILTPKPMWYTFVYFGRRRRTRPTQCASADASARRRHRLPSTCHDHARVAPSGRFKSARV